MGWRRWFCCAARQPHAERGAWQQQCMQVLSCAARQLQQQLVQWAGSVRPHKHACVRPRSALLRSSAPPDRRSCTRRTCPSHHCQRACRHILSLHVPSGGARCRRQQQPVARRRARHSAVGGAAADGAAVAGTEAQAGRGGEPLAARCAASASSGFGEGAGVWQCVQYRCSCGGGGRLALATAVVAAAGAASAAAAAAAMFASVPRVTPRLHSRPATQAQPGAGPLPRSLTR